MILVLLFLLAFSPLWAGTVNSLDRGLILYLKFDERAGTVAGNSEINGGQASTEGTGQSWGSGKFNQSIDLDGNGGLTYPDAARFDVVSFTVSHWLYPETATGGRRRLIQQTDVTNFWGSAYNDRSIEILDNLNGCSPCTSNSKIPLFQWTHVAVVRKAPGYQRIFINGKRDFTQNNPGTGGWSMAAAVGIGVYIPSSNERFIGKIDDGAVWNRALTDGEVMQLYLNGVGNHNR